MNLLVYVTLLFLILVPQSGYAKEVTFPEKYHTLWESKGFGNSGRTEVQRAQSLIYNYVYPIPFLKNRASRILKGHFKRTYANDPDLLRIMDADNYASVFELAKDIKDTVFKNTVPSFGPGSLLTRIRYALIRSMQQGRELSSALPIEETKARQPEEAALRHEVLSFFFDPSIAPQRGAPKADGARYRYPVAPLKVAIVGGGPSGMVTAISLAEKARNTVEIHIYEKRLGDTRRDDFAFTGRRRDQVVTLQDEVTERLSPSTYQKLFERSGEKVWPGSKNIAIKEAEDRLLERAKSREFKNVIFFHNTEITEGNLHEVLGGYHVIVGADGANSLVKQQFFAEHEERSGESYALGVAFKCIGNRLPRSQSLNMFLTVAQSRYLLNATELDATERKIRETETQCGGYMNMQLTEPEWQQLRLQDGSVCSFSNPGCLSVEGKTPNGFTQEKVFLPSKQEENSLWQGIKEGLNLFGIRPEQVKNIVRIPIAVTGLKLGVVETAGTQRPRALVFMVGDAVLGVHFWPGRGMNSGIKEALKVASTIDSAIRNGSVVGLKAENFAEYNAFLATLKERETKGRSMPVMRCSGDPTRLQEKLATASSGTFADAANQFKARTVAIGKRLERRSDWAQLPVDGLERSIDEVLRGMSDGALREMLASGPWPTEEMAGEEVCP